MIRGRVGRPGPSHPPRSTRRPREPRPQAGGGGSAVPVDGTVRWAAALLAPEGGGGAGRGREPGRAQYL